MASTPEGNQPRATDQPPSQSSETDQPRAAADHPPPGGSTPSTMSYAHPQQGYPTSAPPYHGYPPNAYNPYYNQEAAAAYYATTTPYSHQDEAASSCVRCFCVLMLLLLMFSLIASVVMFAVVKPESPSFKVEYFSVSNFNLVPENKAFSGKWDTSIYTDNPSYRLRLYVDRWDASLYHKDNHLVTATDSHGFDLDSKSSGTIKLKMETYNATASGAVEDMQKEQKEGGNVNFNMRLTILYTTRNYGWWYHHYRTGTLRVKCSDLKVGLPVGANTGSMQGGSKGCDITNG